MKSKAVSESRLLDRTLAWGAIIVFLTCAILFYYDPRSVGVLVFFLPLGVALRKKVKPARILRVAVLFVAGVFFTYIITESLEILEFGAGVLGLAIVYAFTVDAKLAFITGFSLGILSAIPLGRKG